MISTPGMEILRDEEGGMTGEGEFCAITRLKTLATQASDLGIPVILQNCFFRAVCPEKLFPTPLYFLRTEKAPGDRRQCLNIVLNNLTCDHAFSPFLSGRGEREKNSSRERHRGIVGRGCDLRLIFAY